MTGIGDRFGVHGRGQHERDRRRMATASGAVAARN